MIPLLKPIFKNGKLVMVAKIHGDARDHVNCRCQLYLGEKRGGMSLNLVRKSLKYHEQNLNDMG